MIGFALLLTMAMQGAELGAELGADAYEPPVLKTYSDCFCPPDVSADVTLSGYVVDAKVILGADRRSVEDRMATIFDVKKSDDSSVSGRTAVWHSTTEKACGVTFDYGKKYTVYARRDDEGELETDSCLMGG